MSNENCLANLSCPKCGYDAKLFIEGTSEFEVIDEGTDGHGDVEWDEKSMTTCPECRHLAPLKRFEIVTTAFVGVLVADKGQVLIGGVTKHESAAFENREHADLWWKLIEESNAKLGRYARVAETKEVRTNRLSVVWADQIL